MVRTSLRSTSFPFFVSLFFAFVRILWLVVVDIMLLSSDVETNKTKTKEEESTNGTVELSEGRGASMETARLWAISIQGNLEEVDDIFPLRLLRLD